VVMRHVDMVRVHPKQDNTKTCSICGQRVGIYPSGQAALKRDPSLTVICQVCDARLPHHGPTALAPGASREPFESVRKRDS